MTTTDLAPAKPKKAREVFGRDGIYEWTERSVRNSLGKRAAAGDLDALIALDRLRADIDRVMAEIAVPGLRSEEGGAFSYREIGEALGITRQAAQLRYPDAKGARQPGAQPAHLR